MWLPGADPSFASTRAEAYRYAGLGMTMLMVAALAAVSFQLYAATVAGTYQWWMPVAATGWGLVILLVDRQILLERPYGRPDGRAADSLAGPVPTRRHSAARLRESLAAMAPRLLIGLLRVAIAVITALLISEAACLVIFRPEIEQVALRDRQVVFDSRIRQLSASAMADVDARIQLKQKELDTAQAEFLRCQQEHKQAVTAYEQEINNPSRPGFGALAATNRKMVDDAAAAEEKAGADLARISAELDTLTAEKGTWTNQSSAAMARLRDGPEAAAARAERDAPIGWLERERALAIFQRENADNRSVVWIPWLLRVLLLIIDLVPLTAKLLDKRTLHGYRLRDQAFLARRADRRMLALQLDEIDAALAARRRQLHRVIELDEEREQRYLRHRVDHLHRPPGNSSAYADGNGNGGYPAGNYLPSAFGTGQPATHPSDQGRA